MKGMPTGVDTCYGWIEVLEVHLLVGPLAASQTPGKDGHVLGQGPLHVLGAATEISAVVELHSPEEHGLGGGDAARGQGDPHTSPPPRALWGTQGIASGLALPWHPTS